MSKSFLFPLVLSLSFSVVGCNRTANTPVRPLPSHATAILPPKPTITQPSEGIWDVSDVDLRSVNRSKKLLAFTFDDAVGNTLENLLAVFAAFNESHPDAPACATLFCNGVYLRDDNVHTLSAAVALGWELGNHTFSHADLTTLPVEVQREEIDKTDVLLSKIDGKPLHLLRAPYGKIDRSVRQTLPVPVLSWNVDTLDWTGVTADEIYRTVMDGLAEGNVVLMHDGVKNTVAAVKRLLPDLYDVGYQVVGVSALAKAHDVPLRNGGEYIRIRPNTHR